MRVKSNIAVSMLSLQSKHFPCNLASNDRHFPKLANLFIEGNLNPKICK